MFHAVSDKANSTEATKVLFDKQDFDVCGCMINFWYSLPSSCLSADYELRNTRPREAVSKLGKGGAVRFGTHLREAANLEAALC